MSEAVRCDYCKVVAPLKVIDSKISATSGPSSSWWRIESHAYENEDGGDFCSATCARNFFDIRVRGRIKKIIKTANEGIQNVDRRESRAQREETGSIDVVGPEDD